MTTLAGARAARTSPGGRRSLAGTGTLLRLALRRDRIVLPVWVYVLLGSVLSTAFSFRGLYDTAAKRAQLAHDMTANGTMRALFGPAFDDSLGGLVAWRLTTFVCAFAGIMSLVIVVRHTRDEEESGRQELLASAMVGRRAPLTAALGAAALANLVAGVLIAVGLVALGRPGGGSLALGLAIAATGLVFAGVAAVAAQLSENGRLARGLTGAAIGAAFVLRAAGDSGAPDGNAVLTWLSPIGWAEQVRPFAGDRWWVLLLLAAFAAAAALAAYLLADRRDLGAGLIAPRPGPASAGRSLSGPFGLAWRLQRGSLYGWTAALLITGLVFGSVAHGASDLLDQNEGMRRIYQRMGGAQSVSDNLLGAILGLMGMVAGLYVVSTVLRARSEETAQRGEFVLAGAAGRVRWAGSHIAIAALGSAAMLVAGGLGAGLSYGAATGDLGGQLPRITAAGAGQIPAVLVVGGLAVLLFGLLPQASAAAWGLAGLFLALGWIGAVLDLPQAVLDLSPFAHLPKLPGAHAAAAPYLWLTLLAAALTAAGLQGLRRRDIG